MQDVYHSLEMGAAAITLSHIAYVSRSERPLDADLLTDILEVSVRNNGRDGITGVLMYHARMFFQVLEGQRGAVERCYERIENDPRHGGVSLIWNHPVSGRVFPDWSMGYAGPEEVGDHREPAFQAIGAVLESPANSPADTCVALRLARLMYLDFKGLGTQRIVTGRWAR